MTKLTAPRMVYITGEEMTRYTMQLILDQWITPHIDTSAWQFFDFSVKARSDSDDQVLRDCVEAGKEIRAIFKEPTITPTKEQAEALGSKQLGSPNGAIRRGWNGITISRDTTHVPGLELGYKNPVLFDRQAVGGEYAAQSASISKKGKAVVTFIPEDGGSEETLFERPLPADSVFVSYHNPLDSIEALGHHFFSRSLEAGVTPYVVTKKTVFKFQEPFWQGLKQVFDKDYKEQFKAKGLLDNTGGELAHLISDAATMKLEVWRDGGFAMVAHNYDGDVLTDLVSQIQRSPAFLTSVLTGITEDGKKIKEFEASHGTVSDMEQARLAGEETSLNPLGLVEALAGAMDYAVEVSGQDEGITAFTAKMRGAMYAALTDGRGTRDIQGDKGLSTEAFIGEVAGMLG